jgi:hypothetical protein
LVPAGIIGVGQQFSSQLWELGAGQRDAPTRTEESRLSTCNGDTAYKPIKSLEKRLSTQGLQEAQGRDRTPKQKMDSIHIPINSSTPTRSQQKSPLSPLAPTGRDNQLTLETGESPDVAQRVNISHIIAATEDGRKDDKVRAAKPLWLINKKPQSIIINQKAGVEIIEGRNSTNTSAAGAPADSVPSYPNQFVVATAKNLPESEFLKQNQKQATERRLTVPISPRFILQRKKQKAQSRGDAIVNNSNFENLNILAHSSETIGGQQQLSPQETEPSIA